MRCSGQVVTLTYAKGKGKDPPYEAILALQPTTGLAVSVTYYVSNEEMTTIYGAYGDRYVNDSSSAVAGVVGVVHVPGGPRESRDLTPNNQMLLPFPFEETVGALVTDHATEFYTDPAGLTKLNELLTSTLLTFANRDDFLDPRENKEGVFLAPTNAALDVLLAEYSDLTGVTNLLVAPYLTPTKRLLQFHTFPVVGAQDLLTVLDIADSGAPTELQANDGWVRTPPPQPLCACTLPISHCLLHSDAADTCPCSFHAGSQRSTSPGHRMLSPPHD